jgi:hypothetical protein
MAYCDSFLAPCGSSQSAFTLFWAGVLGHTGAPPPHTVACQPVYYHQSLHSAPTLLASRLWPILVRLGAREEVFQGARLSRTPGCLGTPSGLLTHPCSLKMWPCPRYIWYDTPRLWLAGPDGHSESSFFPESESPSGKGPDPASK